MKKLIFLAILVIGFAFLSITQAQAADTGTITATVSLSSVISVSLDKTSWNIGSVALNGTNGPEAFVATVGNVATKLEIEGTNGAGAWTLGALPAADTFEVAVASPALKLSTVYQTLAASVAPYGTNNFSLTYTAPSSDTKGAGISQGFTVTVKASAPA